MPVAEPYHAESTPVAELGWVWHYVERKGPDDCWPCRSTLNSHGRPSFRLQADGVPYDLMAVRAVFRLVGVPADGHINSHCGNKLCVNPAHHFVSDGPRRWKRPRPRFTSRMGPPKPNPLHQAILARPDLSQESLAALLGTSQSVVSYVRSKYGQKIDHRATMWARRRAAAATPGSDTGAPPPPSTAGPGASGTPAS